jgi:hypothetical protein
MLTRLTIRFFDVLLILTGSVLAVIGFSALLQKTETQSTTVSITALEKGEIPDARWLRVTGGHLYWGGRINRVKTDRRGNEQKTTFYVPLASEAQAAAWAARESAGGKSALANCRVLVALDPATMRTKFPAEYAGTGENLTTPFDPEGTSHPASAADRDLREFLSANFTDVNLEQLRLLNEGRSPMQKGTAAVLLAAGLALVGVGVLLWRRKRARRNLSPPMVPPAMVPPGGYPPYPAGAVPPLPGSQSPPPMPFRQP